MVIQGPKKIFAPVSSPLVVVFCVGGRGQGGVRGRGRGVAAARVAVGVGDHGGMHSLLGDSVGDCSPGPGLWSCYMATPSQGTLALCWVTGGGQRRSRG